jgi:hypothetical protein
MPFPRTNLSRISTAEKVIRERKRTLPRREVGTLEQSMFKDTFHTTKGGNNIDTVVVQLPKFAIMPLRCPPEGVAANLLSDAHMYVRVTNYALFEKLILLPIRTHSPAPIICETTKSLSALKSPERMMRSLTCVGPSGTEY